MLNSSRGFRIHYDLLGPDDGKVVCMAHSMTSDSGVWAEQVPALLQAGFRVLRIDMRGHGGSDAPDTGIAFADLADDVIAVLDGLGIRKTHYVGLSIGGMIGLKLAIDHSDRLASIFLADTAYSTPRSRAAAEEIARRVRDAGNLLSLVDGNMERRFTDRVRQERPRRWEALRETLLGTKIPGYVACTGAMLEFDFEPELGAIRLPAMIVCGSDDTSTPPEVNRKLAKLIPGASYFEFAGGRHFPNVEFPEKFNSVLLEWLHRQSG